MLSTSYNKEEKIWYGRDMPPLYNPNINVAHALFNAMNIYGSKVAQVTSSFSISTEKKRSNFNEMQFLFR